MTTAASNPRAFAVWFKDLDSWEVRANWLRTTSLCRWAVTPLSQVSRIRFEEVPGDEIADGQVLLLDRISFHEGRVFAGARAKTKMTQYRAKPGDIAVSKINARKRAIGIVPPGKDVGVTIHFRVLVPDSRKADREFLWAALRSTYCRNQFEIETGGMGKGEISEERLRAIKVPVPPLPVQRAIVRRWQEAQDTIAKAQDATRKREENLEDRFLRGIGIRLLLPSPRKGAFALAWSDLERWDTFFHRQDFMHLEKELNAQKARALGEIARFVCRPWSKADFPEGVFRYVEISCVTKEEGITGARAVDVDKAPSRATTLIRSGDVILSTTRPYLGAFTIVPPAYDNCVCTSGFAVAEAVDETRVDKRFLLHFLRSPAGLRQMERRMTGGLYPAIVQSELERIRVPLPPLKVQKSFVAQAEKVQDQVQKDRQAAAKLSAEVSQEVEEMILGTRLSITRGGERAKASFRDGGKTPCLRRRRRIQSGSRVGDT